MVPFSSLCESGEGEGQGTPLFLFSPFKTQIKRKEEAVRTADPPFSFQPL